MRIPLLVELCAGTAALSLRLERSKARPPVSRMGSKAGYSDAILSRMGLHPGQGAEHYLLCEPDPGCRLLLEAYRDRALAQAAAEHIRGWKDEEPRALWERLREEGPAKCPPVDPREVARWVFVIANRTPHADCWKPVPEASAACGVKANLSADGLRSRLATLPTLPATITDDARTVDPREVARWAFLGNGSYRKGDPSSGYDPARAEERPAHATGGRQPGLLEALPPRLATLPTLPATITDDARTVDPREVARWALMGAWSYRQGIPDSGPAVPGECHQTERPGIAARLASLPTLPATITDDARTVDPREVARFAVRSSWSYEQGNTRTGFVGPGDRRQDTTATATKIATLPTLPATITDDARTVDPPQLPAGSWVYIDPPYVGTTGYGHNLGRPEVIALARRWHEAGAHVAVSEAEPIAELIADGWHAHELSRERVGQKRTFSKQQREVLTISRAPRGQLGLL